MKIILVTNKTLMRGNVSRIDSGYWNTYLPLLELGHQVYFYDIIDPIEKDFSKILEREKPDLIFCCITGDSNVGKYEPLEEIKRETQSGRTLTFNWFCDDTWRFENFSRNVCNNFNYCSTPEPSYIEKYKKIGYNNILLGNWHTNVDLYPKVPFKNIDVGFVGLINNQRYSFINKIKNFGIDIKNIYGVSYEDLLLFYSSSKIGINFSINESGAEKKTQMKLRMFEVPAANTLLLTQYHEGIEQFFEIDKEIITFKEEQEMILKIKYLLNNEQIIEKIAKKGYERILKDHNSKIRLSNILREIK